MEIQVDKDRETQTFRSLKEGDLFRLDGSFFIKVAEIYDPEKDITSNAVDLICGNWFDISNDEKVYDINKWHLVRKEN